MAGFNLDIGANTKQFQSGVKDMEKSLDKVADSLDDLTKESIRSTDKAADGFDNATKGAKTTDTAVDRLTGSFKDLSNATAKQADTHLPNLEKKGEKAFFKLGHASGEFKDEALANFSEVTSSFNGSASSIVDLAQGTFGGLAASLPLPLGLAAGALAGIIGGVFSNLSAEADKAAQEAAQSISDMYDDMLASGEKFVSEDFIRTQITATIKDTQKLADARKDAAEAGVSVATILRAQAGDQSALNEVISHTNQLLDDNKEKALTAGQNGQAAADGQSVKLTTLLDKYSQYSKAQDTASSKAQLFRQATSETAGSLLGVGQQLDSVNAKLSKIPSAKTVHVNVEAYTATAEAKIRALAQRPLSILVDAHTRAGDRVF